MKSINPDIVLKPVKEYVLMAVGMLMYSFGWIGCILPAGGVGGWVASPGDSTSSCSNERCRKFICLARS